MRPNHLPARHLQACFKYFIARRSAISAWMISVTAAALYLVSSPVQVRGETPVVFSRDILPILSENCFQCHGPDHKSREADLRLDTQDGAIRKVDPVIVPGKSGESEVIERIVSQDVDEVMPPPKSGKKLTPSQVTLLKRWIDQGAPWGKHWAFEPPKVALPEAVHDRNWSLNPIDDFILARLKIGRDLTIAGRVQGNTDPPAHARPDRATTDHRRGRGIPRRFIAQSLRIAGRPPSRIAGLWRADGDRLARRCPVCRHERLPE